MWNGFSTWCCDSVGFGVFVRAGLTHSVHPVSAKAKTKKRSESMDKIRKMLFT